MSDPNYSVSISSYLLRYQQSAVLSWSAPIGATQSYDVVGLYHAGGDSTSSPASCQITTQGATTGSRGIITTANPGYYQVCYYSGQALMGQDPQQVLLQPNVSFSPPASPVVAGSTIHCTFDSDAISNQDAIGLFACGADASASLQTLTINPQDPHAVLNFTAPNTAGEYEFRYLLFGTTVCAISASFSVTPQAVTQLSAVQWLYPTTGHTLDVTYTTTTPHSDDRIYCNPAPGTPYNGSASIATHGSTQGDAHFSPPFVEGTFVITYQTGSGAILATLDLLVSDQTPQVTLAPDPTEVTPADRVLVTWSSDTCLAGDQIALYDLSDPDAEPLAQVPTQGAATGRAEFTAPGVGHYAFAYLLGGSQTLATSPTLDVVSAPSSPSMVAQNLPDAVPLAELQRIIVNRAINDAEWRARLIDDPHAALAELFGNPPPAGLTIHVVCESGEHLQSGLSGLLYYVVPSAEHMAYTSNENWVVDPLLPPGELHTDGRLPDQQSDVVSPAFNTDLPEVQRGLAQISAGLDSLDDTTTHLAIIYAAPPALRNRIAFHTQIDYRLYTDPAFYQAFSDDPLSALQDQLNYRFPAGVGLRALVQGSDEVYIVLPFRPFDAIFSPPYVLDFQHSATPRVTLANDSGLSDSESLTVETWFRCPDYHTSGDAVLLSTLGSSGGWELRVGGAVPQFSILLDGTLHTVTPSNSRLRLKPGVWYYLAGVYDGSEGGAGLKLYLNDLVLNAGQAASGALGVAATTLCMGVSATPSEGQQPFQGLLYDVRLWRSALDSERLKSDFLTDRSTTPTPQSDLSLWFPMLEGNGTTLYDHSGNQRNAQLDGVFWVSGYPDLDA